MQVTGSNNARIGCELVERGLGPFDHIELLGTGSYGETFGAQRGDERFAIKVIHKPGIGHFWDRELAALARVDHENVVALHTSSSFEVDGRSFLYLECEWIAGGSGKDRIEANSRPQSVVETDTLLRGLLSGLDELHEHGVIHRDLKPANIAFRDQNWGAPVILDFGLAKVLDMSSHTDYPVLMGTAAYMAPEQLRGGPARRRSDLFAVAVSVYEMASGMHPYVDESVDTPEDLLAKMAEAAPASLVSLGAAVSERTDRVLRRLVSYRAHQRLSVEQALADLGT